LAVTSRCPVHIPITWAKTMKVLIVDDDKVLVQFLRRVVERSGHEAVSALDGAAAWNLFLEHTDIGLVISDWMMPELDGLELVRRIRACPRSGYVYVILLTAKSRTEDIVDGMKAGADDFLAKPFAPDELKVRLRAGERIVELEHRLERRNAELESANRRMRRDIDAAARVQKSLLPAAAPEIPGAQFAWAFQPCEEMSGDSLGVVRLDQSHVALHMLDVSGHGVAAALLSVSVSHFMSPVFSTSSLLRQPVPGSSAWRIVSPAEVAAELNRRFPIDEETGRYFTMLYGILDLELRQFCYVSAGHPAPVHVPAAGGAHLLQGAGPPIGVKETAEYCEHSVPTLPGDRIFLYSDGICDAARRDGNMFGTEQLLSAIEEERHLPLNVALNALLKRVLKWTGTNHLRDDASLLAVEVERDRESDRLLPRSKLADGNAGQRF
jgi:sigma-B regulation protein RsbU (phosphoserine phosphatase)